MKRKSEFTPDERKSIALEYLNGDSSTAEMCRKYGIGSHTTLCKWVKRYLSDGKKQKKSLPLPPKPVAECIHNIDLDMAKESQETKDLLFRISELEKQLKWEQMRSHALETMIDIAEEQGMSVRKKSGAKQ